MPKYRAMVDGGPFAALGIIPPKGQVAWSARWNPRQPASIFVRTTPYIGQTDAGPLAAGLTVISIVLETMAGAKIVQAEKAQRFVATAESLRNAALLIRQMLGDDVAGLLTVEGMTSGAFGTAFLEALKEPAKVEVLRQALELVGVTVGTEAVEALLTWVNVLRMSALVIELGWTIASGTSSGGVLFSSFPTPLPAQPTTSPDIPTTTAAPAAPETTSRTPEPSGSAADLDATSIRIANLQPGSAGNVFRCGDTVTLVGTIRNPTSAPIAATVLFDTREAGPDTVTSDSQDIVAPEGDSDYTSQFTIRDDLGPDTVSFQADFHLTVTGTQASATVFHATCS
jgi:hypothetical protein